MPATKTHRWAICAVFSVATVGVSLLAPPAARAGDPFEIQVYDGTANAPGIPSLELHLNDWATGNRGSTPPEVPLHGQFHTTLEPSLGMTPFWELGAYVQGAVRTDEGVVDWAGVKFRSKFVTPPGWNQHWRLGVNLEVSYLPTVYDLANWSGEIRPVVAWQDPKWLFAVNPIFDQGFASSSLSDGPVPAPAAKVARTMGPIALGFEYYATLGPVGGLLPWRKQSQQLFEVIDLLSLEYFELNFGLGEGLTAASQGIVAKVIVGFTWEKEDAQTAIARSPRARL
jgi:hypothetical protein